MNYFARFTVCRKGHFWLEDGDTLGGIWLRCIMCNHVDEFLPGIHEPKGGEAVWQDYLRKHDIPTSEE